jgi:hypothetical protein
MLCDLRILCRSKQLESYLEEANHVQETSQRFDKYSTIRAHVSLTQGAS